MKQIFHIFAKDSRHLWPEILFSLAVTAEFVWNTPHEWPQPGGLGAMASIGILGAFSFSGVSLAPIVVVGWWLLIARVIHDESLVGDRQFWLTRPYSWSHLLAAKATFLLAYLYIPFLAAKLILLDRAGFAPFSYFPGLLFNLLVVSASLVVPLIAIATVTATFARLVLAVLGIILCFMAILVVTSALGSGISFPYGFLIAFLPCVCLVVIVLQYATRRLWLSRSLLIGYPLLILATSFAGESRASMDRQYPSLPGHEGVPIQLSYAHDPAHVATINARPKDTVVQVSVPIEFSGVPDRHMLMSGNVLVRIEAAGRPSWTSGWLGVPRMLFLPGSQTSMVFFPIKRSLVEGFQGLPVTLRLSFGFTMMQSRESRRVALETSNFPVWNFGICSPQIGWDGSGKITGVACKSALRPPPFTYVETVWSSNDVCSSATRNEVDGVKGSAWVGETEQAPAQFGISPVWVDGISFSNGERGDGEHSMFRHLCPGTPLTFTQYDPVGRLRADLTIPQFRFPQ